MHAVALGGSDGKESKPFLSPDRPVENVSWNDAQQFIVKINDLIPGLALSLPSEAQWEYACRAGTTASTYAGDLRILGENNAPALDPIAWYGGNSGQDYDLDAGVETSGWPNKQYPHKNSGTRQVKLKKANGWGLYDMLGNVWEWVEEAYFDYRANMNEGVAREAETAERIVRGGSWSDHPWNVRSACRDAVAPDKRLDVIGFRCARVQT